ncbi:hypothetical protein Bxe_A3265 [Paraburkholderia xenovorans LB400]|uniref:Uncharacterized protein n=1 Tax=Paraburkholderia xenovorans (strain LB400) TaxID=266265 RepID=Q142M2_PARXL|nr:hypothetical protein Bxe_A3265 [Paraburkholderia xenovorans LB400]
MTGVRGVTLERRSVRWVSFRCEQDNACRARAIVHANMHMALRQKTRPGKHDNKGVVTERDYQAQPAIRTPQPSVVDAPPRSLTRDDRGDFA